MEPSVFPRGISFPDENVITGIRTDIRDSQYASNMTLVPEKAIALALEELASTSGVSNYAHYQDEKPSGTHGGSFYSGAWRTRTLNTTKKQIGDKISRTDDTITLEPGTYRIIAKAPAADVDEHKARFRNITDNVTEIYGTSQYTALWSVVSTSDICGYVTVETDSKDFQVQHRCDYTVTNDGFGRACSFDEVEIYTSIIIEKVG